jgi:hypothetical protein
MHARVMFFLPTVTFLLHSFLPKIVFLFYLAYFQEDPNTDMWLIPSHLTLVCFIDLSFDRLKILHEICFLCLGLHSLLLECVQYLHCNLLIDHPCTLCLGLFHLHFCFLHLCNNLCFPLLDRFHLSLALLFLCLHNYELCLQFLHIPCSFDMLRDWHCLMPLLEVLDSCVYPFFFLVPLRLFHLRFCFLHLCNNLCFPLLDRFHLSMVLLFLCLHNYELCLQFLHIPCSFDTLRDWNCLMPLLEVLDSCVYPFFFLVPLLDLLILFQLRPELCFFHEQVGHYVDLSLYLLYLHCYLLLPLLLHLWWSGRCERLLEVLDLIFILIDCLHNMINILCHREFSRLHSLWNFLVGYDQFLLQPIHIVSLILGLDLSLLKYQFHHISIVLFLLQFYCVCACTRLYHMCDADL